MKTFLASLAALALLLAVASPARADVGFESSTLRAGQPGDRVEVTIACGFCFPPCVGEPGDKHAPGTPNGTCMLGSEGGPPASFQVWLTPVGNSLDPSICGPGEWPPGKPARGPCRSGSRPPHLPSFIYLGRAVRPRRGPGGDELPRYRLIFGVPETRPGLYKYVLFCDSCIDGPRGSLVDDRARAAGPLRVLPPVATASGGGGGALPWLGVGLLAGALALGAGLLLRRGRAAALGIVALAAGLGGCGGSDPTASPATKEDGPAPDAIRVPPLEARVITPEHLRRAVLRGVGRDYLGGTQVGPPSFGLCLQRGMRTALDEQSLRALALVYRRPAGQQFTAQALTDMASPIASRCGGRRFVPMLIEASMAFRAGHLPPAGVGARLSYGPYVGITCHDANSTRCDRVGIDLVLRREATAVTAWVGGRRASLRTPGLHTGVAGRDWVGYLNRVGLERHETPFHIASNGRNPGTWAGYPPVYVPVRLEIAYPRGRQVTGVLPRVSLSPGWG